MGEDELIVKAKDIAKRGIDPNEYIEDLTMRETMQGVLDLYQQEKEKNKNLIKQLQEQNIEIQDISKQLREKEEEDIKMRAKFVLSLANYISKDKIRDMKKYREFELQQEYKEFKDDIEWKTYNKILEED